jgi:3',5'-cyclic AMP phosphodiesterase CpdA
MKGLFVSILLVGSALAQQGALSNNPDSLKFAIMGDTGTGDKEQYEVGQRLAEARARFPYTFVVMMGDNMYGSDNPRDYERKFVQPYKPLLDAGIKFYAALGNHDNTTQVKYKHFGMNGERYYSFKPKENVRFFALDSNYMDRKQLEWLEKELSSSGSDWKIAFFHHPLYSSGEKHGSDVELRKVLEPLFVKYGVTVVLSGHEHFYERIKPQQGIYYFVSGGAAKLRKGNINKRSAITAMGFDTDNHFMLAEIDGDAFRFEAISRKGKVFDSGVITRQNGKPVTISRNEAVRAAASGR